MKNSMTRRGFIGTTGAAGAGLIFVKSESVRGTPANSAPGLGIIGCGGRGNHVGEEFVKNTDARVTALMESLRRPAGFDDGTLQQAGAGEELCRSAFGQSLQGLEEL